MADTARIGSAPERIFVKWATPAEEAVSLCKLADALVQRRVAKAQDVAIAAPNRVWAANIERAAESVGVEVSHCIVSEDPHSALEAIGRLESFAEEGLRGRSLAHRAGLDSIAELRHGMLHLQGNEGPEELAELLRSQLASPSVAEGTPCIPVMLAGDLRSTPDYLFVAGCVDGLIPAHEAFDAPTDEERGRAMEAERAAYRKMLDSAGIRAVISYFVKAPETLAAQACLRAMRYKQEDGMRMAMVAPSTFIAEQGAQRPSTTGGQALLRTYGLN